MTGPQIPRLRTTLRSLYQDAASFHHMECEATGEEIHLVARREYEAGLAVLDELVDGDNRFTDHDALVIVRESLDRYLYEIGGRFPLKARLLRSLIGQIDAVEKAAVSNDTMAE